MKTCLRPDTFVLIICLDLCRMFVYSNVWHVCGLFSPCIRGRRVLENRQTADDEKIEKYSQKLSALLAKEGIAHTESFSYLGYNPPYEVINRKNEVIVELID